MKRLILLIIGLLTALSCKGESVEFRQAESASAPMLPEALEPPPTPEWALSNPRSVIGGGSADSTSAFGRVTHARFLHDGGLVVLDASDLRVKFFSPNATHVRSLGGRGQGPGDFRELSDVVVLPGDTVLIFDARADRLTFLQAGSGVIRTQEIPRASIDSSIPAGIQITRRRLLPDGSILMRGVKRDSSIPSSGVSREKVSVFVVFRDSSRAKHVLDVNGIELRRLQLARGERMVASMYPDVDVYLPSYSQSGICIGNLHGSRLQCVNGAGVTTRLEFDLPADSITQSEIAAWRDNAAASLKELGSETEIKAALDRVPVPAVRPMLAGAYIDTDGFLWIASLPSFGKRPDSVRYSILSKTGSVCARTTLPNGIVEQIAGSKLLIRSVDDNDVHTLRIYELSRTLPCRQ